LETRPTIFEVLGYIRLIVQPIPSRDSLGLQRSPNLCILENHTEQSTAPND
jgi:hypothetical protein